VQLAHNVVVGKHCLLIAQVGISGSTRLGQHVTLAGQVGVAGHVEIADHVVVGAQSGISKYLPPNEMYMGSPAVPAREYRHQLAHFRRIEHLLKRIKKVEQELDSKSKSSPAES
jgi:UDP-3-O-[3-hydroxymyristoyl] glucosamine N-acyltransferase